MVHGNWGEGDVVEMSSILGRIEADHIGQSMLLILELHILMNFE